LSEVCEDFPGWTGGQKVAGSNPVAPTIIQKLFKTSPLASTSKGFRISRMHVIAWNWTGLASGVQIRTNALQPSLHVCDSPLFKSPSPQESDQLGFADSTGRVRRCGGVFVPVDSRA